MLHGKLWREWEQLKRIKKANEKDGRQVSEKTEMEFICKTVLMQKYANHTG